MKNQAFWDVTLHPLVNSYRNFEGSWCLIFEVKQSRTLLELLNPEVESTMIVRNARYSLPSNTAPYSENALH